MDAENSRKLPFKTALFYLEELYGLTMDETSFLDVGMVAWRRIGNRQTCKYLMTEQVLDEEGFIELPCSLPYGLFNIVYVVKMTESYLDSGIVPDFSVARYDNTYPHRVVSKFSDKAAYHHALEPDGAYIPYELNEYGIYIKTADENAKYNILYEDLVVDDEYMPMLNQREAEAISAFLALATKQKQLGRGVLKDPSTLQYYQAMWSKAVRNARVPEKLSQNFVDSMLNVMTSMNRKTYNRSLRFHKDA